MNWPIKVGLGLFALALSFFGGWYARPPDVVTVTETQVESRVEVKEVEKIVRQIVRETTTKPDGTVTERVTENTQQSTRTKAKQREEESTAARVVAPATPTADPYRPDYSVGAKWDRFDPAPGSAEVGYRVFGNAWITGEYDWRDREVAVGIRLEL